MTYSNTASARIVAVALLATVVTQVLVLALHQPGGEHAAPHAVFLWRVEALAFLAIGLFGAALIPARPLLGAGLALGGVLNVIQVGIGIAAFRPLLDAGEPEVFEAMRRTAFVFYFAGKFCFGLSAIAFGTSVWRERTGLMHRLGAACGLAGLATMAATGAAIVHGIALVLPAGAVGTLSAALLAVSLLIAPPPAVAARP